jgi:multiple sugar transport system permease protein
LLPGLAGFCIFFAGPFCASLYYAFVDKPGGAFAGLRNFISLFHNPAYTKGLFNTLRFTGLSVPLNLIVSLVLALMIGRTGKNRRWFVLIFLVPPVIPSGPVAFFWKSLLDHRGALNGIFSQFGMPVQDWLDSDTAFPVMTGIFLWKNSGFNTVLYLAGLSNIPQEQYEAAALDGAGKAWMLRAVTLPGLAHSFIVVLIISVINSFKIFREVYLVAGAYPHSSIYTLQHFMNNMFASLNYPRLSAAALGPVIIIAAFAGIFFRLERKISP